MTAEQEKVVYHLLAMLVSKTDLIYDKEILDALKFLGKEILWVPRVNLPEGSTEIQ